MPDRRVREGILTSGPVNSLPGWAEECFYRRLIQVVDDYGLFDARPCVIRARCYPLMLELVREADIERWLAACESAGLILLYGEAHQPLLWLPRLGEKPRSRPKFPVPADRRFSSEYGEILRSFPHLRADARNCAQLCSSAPAPSSSSAPSSAPPSRGVRGGRKGGARAETERAVLRKTLEKTPIGGHP